MKMLNLGGAREGGVGASGYTLHRENESGALAE
jgi:hypothetical protein